MKRKSILAFILTALLIFSLSIIGCGNTSRTRTGNDFGITRYDDDDFDNDGDFIDNDIANNDVRNDVNNVTEQTKDRIEETADSIRYGAANFRNDILNAGYNLTDSTGSKNNYFSGAETDYMLGGDVVRLYEYNSAADLEGDITRIAPNGTTTNGANTINASRPYYYRKGNSLIVYEGKEPAYLDEFGRMYEIGRAHV